MTIRRRLTLWYAILLAIIIVLFGTITFGVMRFTMIENIDSALSETASLVARNSQVFPVQQFGAPSRIEIELADLDLFRASTVYVQAWEIVDGVPVFKQSSANLANVTVPLDPDALGSNTDHFSNVTVQGVDLRVLTRPIVTSGDRVVGNIQVAGDLATVNRATEALLFVMVVSCAVAIMGALLLSLWFSHRALKPIEEITRAAASIAGTNDLSTRLDWNGPNDELGRLTSVFNQMMDRIEHMFSVQQRFIADISHELRTPLTTIKGNVDIVKRYGMDESSLEALESETQRMNRLVNDLLMLARADFGGLTIDLYPLDLDSVVLAAFESAQFLADERDLEIRLAHMEPVRVNGNTDRLMQLMSNLTTNAVKFTADGGTITIGLEHIEDQAVLWVKDTGIGIQPENLQRVFDRFYQTDPARTHTGGGFGLGLPIARWIAETHGGSISVTSQPGIGSTFTVKLPVYTPADDGDGSNGGHTRGQGQSQRSHVPVSDSGGQSHHNNFDNAHPGLQPARSRLVRAQESAT